MGADFYESDEDKSRNAEKGIPNIGIGRNAVIRKAIIDKNARIGSNCIKMSTNNPVGTPRENHVVYW